MQQPNQYVLQRLSEEEQTMATVNRSAGPSIHQLKVTLMDTAPPIWRRFQVESDTTLYRLHQILQVVMGWENYHLYQFTASGTEYGEPDPDFGVRVRSSRTARLSQIAPTRRGKFLYVYDFGDNWGHEILVEKIESPEAGVRYPVCLAGERACPPEDCGGVWGYADLLEIIRAPHDERHEEMMEWLGGSFDPEHFDLEAINRDLRRIRTVLKSRG